MPLSVERVKEIIDLNKRGQKPDDAGMLEMEDTTEDDMHYKDVVGQDSLTRMDRKKKKKKKKPTGKEGGEKAPAAINPPAKQAAPQQSRPAPQQPKPASAPVQKATTPPAQPSGNRSPRQAPDAPKPNQGTGNASARPERKVPGTPENNASAPTSPAPVTPAPTAPTNNPATNSTTPTKSNRPPRKFDRGS